MDPINLNWLFFKKSGEEWKDKNKRLKKEKEIICDAEKDQVYNEHPDKLDVREENYRVIFSIYGTRYNRRRLINEASRRTGEQESRIRSKLYSNFKGYSIIQKVKHGYESEASSYRRRL